MGSKRWRKMYLKVTLSPRHLWRQLPIFALFLAGLLSAKSSLYSIHFYEVAAQIIPVVLLVLAIEFRAFAIPFENLRISRSTSTEKDSPEEMERQLQQIIEEDWEGPVWVALLLILFALISGELVSLIAVGTQDAGGHIAQGVVLGGIAGGFVRIAIDALRWSRPSR
jgi:hypothetical protein